jgi:hypothetical protein
MELFFDAIDGFDQIVLIAAREGHARNGSLNGNQRLVYCGLLRSIHGWKFEPVSAKAASPKTKAPPGAGLSQRQSANRYLAGAVDDASVVDLLCLWLLLWLFLL